MVEQQGHRAHDFAMTEPGQCHRAVRGLLYDLDHTVFHHIGALTRLSFAEQKISRLKVDFIRR
jgi:hypothetical protein